MIPTMLRTLIRRYAPPSPEGRRDKPRLRYLLSFLRWGTVAVLLTLLLLDIAFPLPLPKASDPATVITARDGSPLRAGPDASQCSWR